VRHTPSSVLSGLSDELFCSLLASLLVSCADTPTGAHGANSKIANAAAPIAFDDLLLMVFPFGRLLTNQVY